MSTIQSLMDDLKTKGSDKTRSTYVKPLLALAKKSAQQIGSISVDMGETSCKVPLASASIAKVEAASRIGQKRKTIRC
jgi:hypothetical protein